MGLDSSDYWRKDETAALIALYESEKILYDRKDEHHFDVDERNNAYERIRKIMQRIRPDCTVDDIRSRIKYIFTQYASELLRKNISIESGLCTEDTYKPVMWCFGLLQFLDDYIPKRKSPKSNSYEEDESEESDSTDDDNLNSTITCIPKRNFSQEKLILSSSTDVTEKNGDSDVIAQFKVWKKKKMENKSSSEPAMESGEKVLLTHSQKKRKTECLTSSENSKESTENIASSSILRKAFIDCPSSSENSTESTEKSSVLNSHKKKKLDCSSLSEASNHSTDKSSMLNIHKNKKTNNSSPSDTSKEVSETVSESSTSKEVENFSESAENSSPLNKQEEKKMDSPPLSENSVQPTEKKSELSSYDREDIFGQYVAGELRALKNNPLLYLQTKQSIFEILTSANFEFINPE